MYCSEFPYNATMADIIVFFIGKVYPNVNLTIPTVPTLALTLSDGEKVELKCTLSKSDLRVRCKLHEYKHVGPHYPKFWDLYWGVIEICRAFVDLASFRYGISLTPVLETFIDPSETEEK